MKTDLSFEHIATALSRLALPEVDAVVGIARGGIVPASLLAYRLGCGLAVMSVNFRDDSNAPRHDAPHVYSTPVLADSVRSVLLVDDVSVSGATLEAARAVLPGYAITTLVLKGKADIVVFPDIRTCVNWPWSAAWSPNGQVTDAPQPARSS